MPALRWEHASSLPSKSYTCGYCGKNLASQVGYKAQNDDGRGPGYIYICHFCSGPTHFAPGGKQTPGCSFGDSVDHISDTGVAAMYDEARKAFGAGAFSAAVLCCRKLLMHIAVSKGATEGQNFVSYVEYLSAKHYVPPDATDWVDHIRRRGNEANHEIRLSTNEEAEELISFSEMLLKVIFEFPGTVKRKMPAPKSP